MTERRRLTARRVADLQPRASRYLVWDKDHAGFGVRVTPQGCKSFVYMYRFDGTARMLTLGSTPPLTLEQARSEFAKAQAKVMLANHQRRHEGKQPASELDPAATKSERRQVRNDSPTIAELWDLYQRRPDRTLRPRTLYEYERMMKVNIVPELGAMKAVDVRRRDVKRFLEEIREHRGPVIANRTHGLLAGLFNLAVNEELIEASPMRELKQPSKESHRQRSLTDAELRGLFVALPQTTLPARVRLALQLVLVTGVRPGEARSMRWGDVDEDARLWTVPAEFVKTKKPHAVPLSPLALQLIEECRPLRAHDVWVFPAARGKKPMHDAGLSGPLLEATTAACLRDQGVAPFTPHDLRRSCRTGLARLHVPRHVAEAVIGHEHRRGIEQVYDQYDLLDERREALERWAAHLEVLRAGPSVLPLKSAA